MFRHSPLSRHRGSISSDSLTLSQTIDTPLNVMENVDLHDCFPWTGPTPVTPLFSLKVSTTIARLDDGSFQAHSWALP